MGFLDVTNNHILFDECSAEYRAREIVNIHNIQHVYVMMPDKTDICIEYINYKGQERKIIECYANEIRCNARYNQIKKIIKAQ